MRGTAFAIGEILVFLLGASLLGFLVGRLTASARAKLPGGASPKEYIQTLKSRNEDLESQLADAIDRADETEKKLFVAYETIGELEADKVRLAGVVDAFGGGGSETGNGDGEGATTDADAGETMEEAFDAVAEAKQLRAEIEARDEHIDALRGQLGDAMEKITSATRDRRAELEELQRLRDELESAAASLESVGHDIPAEASGE